MYCVETPCPSNQVASVVHLKLQDAVERVFERSARLNGDAVVVFMRSLAAISQEELVPVGVTDRPR